MEQLKAKLSESHLRGATFVNNCVVENYLKTRQLNNANDLLRANKNPVGGSQADRGKLLKDYTCFDLIRIMFV